MLAVRSLPMKSRRKKKKKKKLVHDAVYINLRPCDVRWSSCMIMTPSTRNGSSGLALFSGLSRVDS